MDLIAAALRCLINLRPVRQRKDGMEETIPESGEVKRPPDELLEDNF